MMIEQPLAWDDLVDHATLQKRLQTPLCLDESIRSPDDARRALASGGSDPRSRQVFFCGRPMGADARIAWVYPGSGNHYLGMGRDLALRFPGIVARMDRDTAKLKTQFRPWHLMPWRQSWHLGWEADAISAIKADPLNMIFGQVVFGSLMAGVLKRFGIRSDAVIGYSLGESAALFAHGVWKDRGDMLARMQDTDLFTTQLAGPCSALRQAWRIADDTLVAWQVAVVNRPAKLVRQALEGIDRVRLLIVNSPNECVIGGLTPAVEKAIADVIRAGGRTADIATAGEPVLTTAGMTDAILGKLD